ncbi:MAG: hypothetical protein KME17_09395 [Cyanosarcina radialis HA8281-LM2]|nr:hypothetical protein [Cyanosarcina radialis HA8281-LM2]
MSTIWKRSPGRENGRSRFTPRLGLVGFSPLHPTYSYFTVLAVSFHWGALLQRNARLPLWNFLSIDRL